MRQPFTTKYGLAVGLALAMVVGSAPATAAPTAVKTVTPTAASLIEQAARELLQEQARHNGLRDAELMLEVVSAQPQPRSCRDTPSISALDTRHVSRMRFVAYCASESWREEYTVRAEVSAQVLVAATRITAGQPITADALRLEKRVLAAPQEALSDTAEVVGQASRRALQPGQVVERRMLASAVLVRRGATVQIVARNAGIVVTSVGQATEAGHRDDIIGVRNAVSGKLIRARVTGVDEVEPADIAPQSP
ncbi:MAG TPA: flagellar basal body P-ring formation chaperone FlgA [Rhodocyclaceae bacterium]|nr:flagellar basal body P-ring formation chaperone FlgA [Rhodocyclaceae bacterium]